MFKKVMIVGGILLLVFVVINLISVNSSSIYAPKDGTSVEVSLGAGDFNIDTGSQKGTITTTLTHKLLARPLIKTQDKYLGIQMRSGNGKMTIPTDVKFESVAIVAGAGDFGFNLTDAKVAKLNATLGASNVVLFVPKDISSSINLTIGAGNLLVKIPTQGNLEGVQILSGNLSNMNLGDGFEKITGGIQTKGFGQAKVKSIINLAGSGALQLNIEGVQ